MADDGIKQDEIEALLRQAQASLDGAEDSASLPSSGSQSPTATTPNGPERSPVATSATTPAETSGASAGSKALENVALAQSEIEALLSDTSLAAGDGGPGPYNEPVATYTAPSPASGTVTPGDVELLLQQAEAAIASIEEPSPLPPGVKNFEFRDFAGSPASTEVTTLELVRDVQLDLKIELGRTHMHLEDVLRLRRGAVVTLDKLAGDPVDIFVNSRMIARGEVLVLNDNFCVRVTELVVGDSACA